MEILSTDRTSSFSIKLRSIDQTHFPSMGWSVSVLDGDFRGANPRMHVAMEDFSRFLAELRECDRTRKGSARLESMSPGECELVFAQTEAWGHFSLKYKIGRTTYDSYGNNNFHSISGQFELDSEYFTRLVSALEKLPNDSPEETD